MHGRHVRVIIGQVMLPVENGVLEGASAAWPSTFAAAAHQLQILLSHRGYWVSSHVLPLAFVALLYVHVAMQLGHFGATQARL